MNTKKKDYNKRIAIDLNEEQYNNLQEYCLKHKLTKAEVVRGLISNLNYPINPLDINSFDLSDRLAIGTVTVETVYGYLNGIFELIYEYKGSNEDELKNRLCRKIYNFLETKHPKILKELENYRESTYDALIINAGTADDYYSKSIEEDKVF